MKKRRHREDEEDDLLSSDETAALIPRSRAWRRGRRSGSRAWRRGHRSGSSTDKHPPAVELRSLKEEPPVWIGDSLEVTKRKEGEVRMARNMDGISLSSAIPAHKRPIRLFLSGLA